MVLDQALPIPQETALVTFDFTDIANGLGFSTFHPFFSEDSNGFPDYSLSSLQLAVSTTTGLIDTPYEHVFESSDFNLPRTVAGTAFLTGFINTDGKVTAQIIKRTGTASGVLGSVTESNATEQTSQSVTYTLEKTFNITGFRNKVVNQIKSGSGTRTAICKVTYHYTDNSITPTADVENSTTSISYTEKTYSNPHPNERIFKIEVFLRISNDDTIASLKEDDVYEQVISGITDTTITSALSTPTYSSNINFNLSLPITQTLIKKGERVAIKITHVGSGIVVDPLNLINSNPSLKLNLPFKIDL